MDTKPILAAITAGTAVPVIVGWLWLTEFFYLRADAEEAHAHIDKSLEVVTVNWELEKTNSDMAFLEQDDISQAEQREYDMLKFQLEFLTKKSLELGQ